MRKKYLAIPYLFWLFCFVLAPIGFIFYYGITDPEGIFTLENILRISDPIHLEALLLSLKLALISTLICLLLAYPLAIILSKMKTKRTGFIVFLFILPMWMNFLLRTMSWQLLLSNNGVFNNILGVFNLPHIRIINTQYAIILGMIYDYLPFMILPIYNAIDKIDHDFYDAAKDLGANSFVIFQKIIFPLSLSGVISGIIMVFVPSMTTFVISDLLGGGKILLIGNVIEQAFMQTSEWNLGSGLSIVLMMIVILSMAYTSLSGKNEEDNAVW